MEAPRSFPQPLLHGEHVLATDPPLARETGSDWRRRPRAFTGRALSHHALASGQISQAGMQRLRGQAVSAGVLNGLSVNRVAAIGAPDPHFLTIGPGSGLARSGEDIRLTGGTVDLRALPVFGPPEWFDGDAEEGEDVESDLPEPGDLSNPPSTPATSPPRPRIEGPVLGEQEDDSILPRLAVLVAQPVTVELPDPGDSQCPPDRRDIGWLDPLSVDGTRLVLYAWPEDVRAISGTATGYRIDTSSDQARSRIAQRIFALEAQHGRGDMHPWEEVGMPLALVAFTPDWQIDWIDSAAVQRRGGQPSMRSHIPGTRENPVLAEARLAQFAGHLAEVMDGGAAAIRRTMIAVPPAGLLPGSLFDLRTHKQSLFPDGFDISLAPAMAEEIDRLVGESAGLAPIAFEQPEKIDLLLPVPARDYDPDLLVIETLDPRFAETREQLLDARGTGMKQREDLRRRFDILGLATRGARGIWPANGAEEDELAARSFFALPQDTARGFAMVADGSTPAEISFAGSFNLPLRPEYALFLWVAWEGGSTPRQLAFKAGTGDRELDAFWGDPAGPLARPRGDKANHLGPMPESKGSWQRLEIPVDLLRDGQGDAWKADRLAKLKIAIAGGQIRLGAVGYGDASGNRTYLANGFMAKGTFDHSGKVEPTNPDFTFSPGYGVAAKGDLLQSSALLGFLARWAQPAVADVRTLAESGGLIAAEADLAARLKRTNDAIDVGFVRARADMYRLRQYILGHEEASRLVTSPALADIAVRDESARANAQDLASFLTRIKAADSKIISQVAAASSASSSGGSSGNTSSASTGGSTPVFEYMPLHIAAMPMLFISQPKEEAAHASTFTVKEARISNTGTSTITSSFVSLYQPAPVTMTETASSAVFGLANIGAASQPSAVLGAAATTGTATSSPQISARKTVETIGMDALFQARKSLGIFDSKIVASDILGQMPLPGIVDRTVTVAERLKPSDAAKSHEYALAGKLAVLNTLTRLVATTADDQSGVVLGDILAPGFALIDDDADPAAADTDFQPATLADMAEVPAGKEQIDLRDIERLKARDTNGAGETVVESAYFSAAVAAIDDAVALMRLVEGRVDMFERVLADLRETLKAIRADGDQLEAALETQDAELAEIRHDLMATAALEAEERARVTDTNARRAAVIDRYSSRIIFRRPRLAPIVDAAASAEVQPGNLPDPVVACLADHDDQPEELREFCALLHDAPAGWFPEIAAEIARLDRISAAQKLLALAVARAKALPVLAQVNTRQPSKGMAAIQARLSARRSAVQTMRAATARLDLAQIARFDLFRLHGEIRRATSVGDVIDGAKDRPELARKAATQLASIAHIAACLHATFGEVQPALRMQWAQLFSVHDEVTGSLANLGALPGWGTVPIALRRELQGLVDWLFARFDRSDADALDTVETLVRIALLLAAHAPADELIPATLVEPVPLRPGGLVPLRIPADRIRLGQTGIIRDRLGQPVASIRAETITPTHVEARIVQDFGLATKILPTMPITLGGGRMRQ